MFPCRACPVRNAITALQYHFSFWTKIYHWTSLSAKTLWFCPNFSGNRKLESRFLPSPVTHMLSVISGSSSSHNSSLHPFYSLEELNWENLQEITIQPHSLQLLRTTRRIWGAVQMCCWGFSIQAELLRHPRPRSEGEQQVSNEDREQIWPQAGLGGNSRQQGFHSLSLGDLRIDMAKGWRVRCQVLWPV